MKNKDIRIEMLSKCCAPKESISQCCNANTIPPYFEYTERVDGLWSAYTYYICKNCGKACNTLTI